MDDLIESKMLSALYDTGTPDAPATIENRIDQIRYLHRNIDIISVEDRKALARILIANNKNKALVPCAEGTIINLDSLSDEIISAMHNLIKYKMEKRI